MAPHLAVVSTKTCEKMVNPTKPFILVVDKGENVIDALLHCAHTMNIKAASLSGLGATGDVSVAFYHLDTKEYAIKEFTGDFELVSLTGNIAKHEGKPVVHIHAAMGNEDYSLFGGHIMKMIVSVTAEITVIPLDGEIERQYAPDIGLNLMCPIR